MLADAAASGVLCAVEKGDWVWVAGGGGRGADSAVVFHAGHFNIAKLLEYGRENYCPRREPSTFVR